MMKCMPKHTVSYRGKFYCANEAFDIDESDADEMCQYGTITPLDGKARTGEKVEGEPLRKSKKKQ